MSAASSLLKPFAGFQLARLDVLAEGDPITQAHNVSLREHANNLRRENTRLRQALAAAERTVQVQRTRAEAARKSVRIWARIAANKP